MRWGVWGDVCGYGKVWGEVREDEGRSLGDVEKCRGGVGKCWGRYEKMWRCEKVSWGVAEVREMWVEV